MLGSRNEGAMRSFTSGRFQRHSSFVAVRVTACELAWIQTSIDYFAEVHESPLHPG